MVQHVPLQDIKLHSTRINNMAVAEREWRAIWRTEEKTRLQSLHLMTGSVLPLLPTITKVVEGHRGFGGRTQRLKVGGGRGFVGGRGRGLWIRCGVVVMAVVM